MRSTAFPMAVLSSNGFSLGNVSNSESPFILTLCLRLAGFFEVCTFREEDEKVRENVTSNDGGTREDLGVCEI